MTKNDIIKEVSKETGFTNVEVELLLDSVINSIKISLSKGEKVDMRGFGSFLVKQRKARDARNPFPFFSGSPNFPTMDFPTSLVFNPNGREPVYFPE